MIIFALDPPLSVVEGTIMVGVMSILTELVQNGNESGAVTGRRVLGGTDGLRRLMI